MAYRKRALALNNHRLLLGAYEDVEQQNEFDLLQIVEDLLGGYWEKPLSKWEGRRDAVLDLIGKATPGTFQPSLQIDGTGAKLLIEALSGANGLTTASLLALDAGAMTPIGGKKEPFGSTSPMRLLFSSQR